MEPPLGDRTAAVAHRQVAAAVAVPGRLAGPSPAPQEVQLGLRMDSVVVAERQDRIVEEIVQEPARLSVEARQYHQSCCDRPIDQQQKPQIEQQ